MTPRGLGRAGIRSGTPSGTRSARRTAALAVTFAALAVTLSGCSWREAVGLGWPEGITPDAQFSRTYWMGTVIAALVVGVIVYGLFFVCATVFRKKKTDTELPRQFGYNMPLELVLTVIPIVIVGVLFYFTVITENKFLNREPNPEVTVDVTAFQWNWKFGYQKVAFKDGSFNFDGVDAAQQAALRSKPEGVDKHGEELVGAIAGLNPADRSYLNFDKVETVGTTEEIPILVLPVGKRIEFQQASADVIHSFWIPDFLFKRDVFPNPKANHSENIWQVDEITKTGAFVGRCAEMCGTYHAMMNFEIRVVSAEEFKTYLQARIAGKTNAEALQAIGQSPVATTTHPFDSRRGELVGAQTGLLPQASK